MSLVRLNALTYNLFSVVQVELIIYQLCEQHFSLHKEANSETVGIGLYSAKKNISTVGQKSSPHFFTFMFPERKCVKICTLWEKLQTRSDILQGQARFKSG